MQITYIHEKSVKFKLPITSPTSFMGQTPVNRLTLFFLMSHPPLTQCDYRQENKSWLELHLDAARKIYLNISQKISSIKKVINDCLFMLLVDSSFRSSVGECCQYRHGTSQSKPHMYMCSRLVIVTKLAESERHKTSGLSSHSHSLVETTNVLMASDRNKTCGEVSDCVIANHEFCDIRPHLFGHWPQSICISVVSYS